MVVDLTFRERLLRRLHVLPSPFLDAFGSVLFGRALAIAANRGFFESLREAPCTKTDLSLNTGYRVDGVGLLADAFVEGGYLVRSGEAYALSAEGRKWLLRDSPHSIVNLLGYFELLHRRWISLEESLVNGRPAAPYYATFDDRAWELYVLGMRDLARFLLPHVIKELRIPRGTSRMLDVGGSHGLYAMECCRRSEGLTATVLDFEQPLRIASRLIDQSGLRKRVQTLAGDFLTVDVPAGQDLILVFNVIHGLTDEQNGALMARLLNAVVTGGRMYILDQMTGDRRASSLGRFLPLMVGLNLLNEIGGKAYAAADIRRWCKEARAVNVRRLGLPGVGLVEVVR